jgi:hypothetical protein
VLIRADVVATFVAAPQDRFSALSATAVAAVIGPADAALAVNDTKIIVVDDGTSSAVFFFQSADGDANVTVDEIYLVGVVTGEAALAAGDLMLLG